MKKPIVAIVVVLALAGGAWAAWHYWRAGHGDGQRLDLHGNIEVDQVDLSFRTPGWVRTRAVDEGQPVHKNQVVAELDDRELKDQVQMAEGDLHTAQATLAELVAGSRPEEIARAEAALRQADADVEYATRDSKRMDDLYAQHLATEQERDQARTALKRAREVQAQAKETLTLAKLGPRQEVINQARARVEQSQASLQAAKTRLSYGQIICPVDGIALSKDIEPGEYVTAGTAVLTVADLHNVYVRVFVNETDIGHVKLGQECEVRSDTFPGKVYKGRVGFISQEAEFTPKTVQTEKERVKLVFRVKVYVDNPAMELKPGMPADVEILTDS